MTADILPVITPNVSWGELLDNFFNLTGKKLTESTDLSSVRLSEPAQTLVAIYSIRAQPIDPLGVLRNCLPFVGPHLTYGFLVVTEPDTLMNLKGYTQLDTQYTVNDDGLAVGIITGNLNTWFQTIVYASMVQEKDCRQLLNKVMLYFEKEGLGNIFDGWAKKNMDDGTFKLEYKK